MSSSPLPKVTERRARKLLRTMLARPRMLREATALFAPDLTRTEITATVETAERMLARASQPPAPRTRRRGSPRLVLARDDVWELVEAYLRQNPEARSPEVVAYLRRHGPLPYAEGSIRTRMTAIRKRLGIEIKPGFPPKERAS